VPVEGIHDDEKMDEPNAFVIGPFGKVRDSERSRLVEATEDATEVEWRKPGRVTLAMLVFDSGI
jgi:hypothetical protein